MDSLTFHFHFSLSLSLSQLTWESRTSYLANDDNFGESYLVPRTSPTTINVNNTSFPYFLISSVTPGNFIVLLKHPLVEIQQI